MELTIIAFNYGNAGAYMNGPGICLVSFVKDLRSVGVKVNIFSKLKSVYPDALPLADAVSLNQAIKRSYAVHHWSGISKDFAKILLYAKKLNKKIYIGPNILDGVYAHKEYEYLKEVNFDILFTVNRHLRYKLSKIHDINLEKIKIMMVGPDRELWAPNQKDNGKILWKGNSRQIVKDVGFALKVKDALPEYEFEFIGYPEPYNYMEHIEKAKSCHLYFSTSLSETMGMTIAEAWVSGIPTITHPKVFLHGRNYYTGIITSKNLNDYCEAIIEVMENQSLYKELSKGAITYAEKKFGSVAQDYVDGFLNES